MLSGGCKSAQIGPISRASGGLQVARFTLIQLRNGRIDPLTGQLPKMQVRVGSHAKLNRPCRTMPNCTFATLTCHPAERELATDEPFRRPGESIRAEFGVSAASLAQFGPSVLAGNDVGEGRRDFGALGETDTFGANSAMKTRLIFGRCVGQFLVNTLSKGPVPPKSGMKLQKRATPVEDGNE